LLARRGNAAKLARTMPYDLTHSIVGNWTVKEREPPGSHKGPAWECVCNKCGKELAFTTVTLVGHIRRGSGPICPVCPPPVSPRFIDLAGREMAGVGVCRRLPNDHKGSAVWMVRYGCSHESPRKAAELRFYEKHGLSLSCPICRSLARENETPTSQGST